VAINIQTALRVIYPARCMTCGTAVLSDFGLCGPCRREAWFPVGLVCDLCGVQLPGGRPGEVAHCDECMQIPRPWRQGRAALLYKGTGRKMVLMLKHGNRPDLAVAGGAWMAEALRGVVTAGILIAPVPLNRWRLLKRRYNQSALLARSLARVLHEEGCPDLMQRPRRTPPLDGKGVNARFVALDGAIRVPEARRALTEGRHVLVVDDVMTSGATLAEATRACLEAGAADVSVVTLARVAKEP